MDVVKVVYSVILLVVGLFIFIAPMIQKGDERKRFIYSKAQSYAFMVVIGMLLLEVAQSIFLTIQGNHSDKGFGISPIMFLTVISVIYLVTLLIYRKKYGD
ncbi:integral membrane protein [Bacillus stratosphericus LAMA 585]|nr:integral membrane protein [Bacillus stratosphericus LAMA 585]